MFPKRHLISGRWFHVSRKDLGQITEPRGTGGNVQTLLVIGKNIIAKKYSLVVEGAPNHIFSPSQGDESC